MTIVVDGHEDIAFNMLARGRDYTRSAHAVRQAEQAAASPAAREPATLGLDDWLAGRVGLIFATLFAEPAHNYGLVGKAFYTTPQEAHQQAMQQLDAYHRLADEQARFRLVTDRRDLDEVLATWPADDAGAPGPAQGPDARQIGLVVLMEGADPIVEPDQAALWYERGVRMVGLAWLRTRYAGGTHQPGPLSEAGVRLLRVMGQLNMALDLSHCAEQAFFQALDAYAGPVMASHSNLRRFVNTDRHLSDAMLRRLVEHDGVIGISPVNAMVKQGWQRAEGQSPATLTDVAAVIDAVCQLTGNAAHVGLGTDFDGGYGRDDLPAELDTIADIGKIGQALLERGYTAADIQAIMGGNWLRFVRQVLP